MNNFWSKKVQSTETLQYSRVEKFNDENKELYFKLLGVENGMKILEVGCGGGHFCNMIKKYFPDCEVYGIDIDEGHIAFAQQWASERNINVNFSIADVYDLPFEDATFDLVFSHTVVEHVEFDKFITSQKRVLKNGGRIAIMRVNTEDSKTDYPFLEFEEEINAVYRKLDLPQPAQVGMYRSSPNIYMQKLGSLGFKNIDIYFDRIVYYNPDCATTKAIAKKQIERNFETKLYYALFNLQLATNGKDYRTALVSLLEKQRDARLKLLEKHEKIFDMQSSNMITVSAEK